MKTKVFTLIIAGMSLSVSSFSQDVKPQVEKAINNPSAKDNAAKADVYHHQKAMTDSANLISKPGKLTSKKPGGKTCSRKHAKSS